MEIYAWLFAVAVVFTTFGYSCGIRKNMENVTQELLQLLVKNKYLKYKRNANGKIELVKHK